MGGGPITKLGISALKIKKLHNKLDVIKKKQEQNILDYRRGQAERKVGDMSSTQDASIINNLMDRSVIKYKKLEIEENKIKKQLYKITKDGE